MESPQLPAFHHANCAAQHSLPAPFVRCRSIPETHGYTSGLKSALSTVPQHSMQVVAAYQKAMVTQWIEKIYRVCTQPPLPTGPSALAARQPCSAPFELIRCHQL